MGIVLVRENVEVLALNIVTAEDPGNPLTSMTSAPGQVSIMRFAAVGKFSASIPGGSSHSGCMFPTTRLPEPDRWQLQRLCNWYCGRVV